MPPVALAEAAARLDILANDRRIEILMVVHESPEIPVGAIVEAVGLTQPAISHALGLLKLAGLVDGCRDGKRVLYSLTEAGSAAVAAVLRVAAIAA